MAKKHGAKQQKKLARQKAKRQAKRSVIAQRTSKDPTIRLRRTESWPVIGALTSAGLWEEGIGYLVLAREEPEGGTVFATFLVDVFCLGVKNAFWEAGTREDYREMVRRMEEVQKMATIAPACLVKIVKGAVEYAQALGFSPHPDYRHAALLLEGIDPADCHHEYTYGKDGKPFYFQGPHESPVQVKAILERVRAAGGEFIIGGPPGALDELVPVEDDGDEDDDEDDLEEPGWTWSGPEPGWRR